MPIVDPSYHYAWLLWASVFLLSWRVLFVAWPALRRPMLWVSAPTSLFGLTEPLFVPAYWNPPSLFDLAHRTGFDIESLIFCFAIGGLAAAGYRVPAPASEHAFAPQARNSHSHRWHRAALVSPVFVFGVLLLLPWNPIYPGIAALFVAALASCLYRPDLWCNTLVGGVLFLALYTVFLLGLKTVWPGYIQAVWNLGDLIAWRPAGLPLEKLLFGFGFGMYWSCVYEHVTWRQGTVASFIDKGEPMKYRLIRPSRFANAEAVACLKIPIPARRAALDRPARPRPVNTERWPIHVRGFVIADETEQLTANSGSATALMNDASRQCDSAVHCVLRFFLFHPCLVEDHFHHDRYDHRGRRDRTSASR